MNPALRALLVVAGIAVVLGSGVVMTRAGRPYGTGMLTVHKLVDLAVVVAVSVATYQANRTALCPPQPGR